jgi:hypothetical protein
MITTRHIFLRLLDYAVVVGYLHDTVFLDVIGVGRRQGLDQVWFGRRNIVRLGWVNAEVVKVPLLIAKRGQIAYQSTNL